MEPRECVREERIAEAVTEEGDGGCGGSELRDEKAFLRLFDADRCDDNEGPIGVGTRAGTGLLIVAGSSRAVSLRKVW